MLFCAASTCSTKEAAMRLEPVAFVDLNRYTGKWYEIARYPNRFQRDCEGNVTASYTLRSDGKIRIVNECRKQDGRGKSAVGTARVVDRKTNSRLKVTFFWPFSGDYWILALGPEYEYAVVGEPSRKYLWILSRSPQMEERLYQDLQKKITAQGYDITRLVRTKQE
jgi:apolipoprotein D and lipocalin family protein